MKTITGKIIVGAALAVSLGTFTIPAGASLPPNGHNYSANQPLAGVQIAQLARDVDQKADEMKAEAKGAAHAVREVHRRHERNEYRHRTIGSKLDSKVYEVKNETTGAGRAIERAHDRHEALEHAEGRD
jgi:hypothetical protein